MGQYKNAVCRGSIALGTGCRRCERCTEDLARIELAGLKAGTKAPGTDEIAAKVAAAAAEAKPPGFQGKLNIYVCDTCRGHIVTRDVDEGVTPAFLNCRATEDCEGTMQSSMYRVFDQTMREDHQWFRPSSAECMGLSAGVLDHVGNGGLLLRKAQP